VPKGAAPPLKARESDRPARQQGSTVEWNSCYPINLAVRRRERPSSGAFAALPVVACLFNGLPVWHSIKDHDLLSAAAGISRRYQRRNYCRRETVVNQQSRVSPFERFRHDYISRRMQLSNCSLSANGTGYARFRHQKPVRTIAGTLDPKVCEVEDHLV
jgi:hypothetical protein